MAGTGEDEVGRRDAETQVTQTGSKNATCPSSAERRSSIPITVIGGYLGAGKTTMLNALLRQPGGRRLGVVVNDFGELGVDASLIDSDNDSSVPVVNLANGCVCCTLGEDLGTTLTAMASIEPAIDQIVIEASGVADPAATAAWGTLAPFVPGGTIVLAAADAVRRMSRDRYVGREVLRQLTGADLLVLTKSDIVGEVRADETVHWLARVSEAPVLIAQMGEVGADLVLGAARSGRSRSTTDASVSVDDRYIRWAWVPSGAVDRASLDSFLAELPPGMLRLKGVVNVTNGGNQQLTLLQVVGASISVTAVDDTGFVGIEAIGVRSVLDPLQLEESALKYLCS